MYLQVILFKQIYGCYIKKIPPASGGLLFTDQKHIVYITSPFVIITDIMNSSGSYSGYGTSLFYTKEISSIIGKGFAKSHQSSFPVFITIIW